MRTLAALLRNAVSNPEHSGANLVKMAKSWWTLTNSSLGRGGLRRRMMNKPQPDIAAICFIAAALIAVLAVLVGGLG